MVRMRLIINALEEGPYHCFGHADVSMQKVPKGNNNDIGSFSAPLEGVKACRDFNIVVAVVVEWCVRRPGCSVRQSEDVVLDYVPFRKPVWKRR